MTSTSGRDGYCDRCGCANNNHTFETCLGYDKRGSKWKRCSFEWVRCTTNSHMSALLAGEHHYYVDCYRCPDHPGAPPVGFYGTQLDEEDYVFTADELQIERPSSVDHQAPGPGPASEHVRDKGKGKGKDKGKGKGMRKDSEKVKEATTSIGEGSSTHGRTLSQESLDPLQWDDAKLVEDKLTLGIANLNLTDSFGNMPQEAQPSLPDEPIDIKTCVAVTVTKVVDDNGQRKLHCLRPDKKTMAVAEQDWFPCKLKRHGQSYDGFIYKGNSGRVFSTFSLEPAKERAR